MFNPEYREPIPPEGWPVWRMKLFYDQSFRLQCFIFLKYRMHWPKKCIRKFLFLNSEGWYYKYNRLARELVMKAFDWVEV